MSNILDTGVRRVKNVGRYNIGAGSLTELRGLLAERRALAQAAGRSPAVVLLVDEFFRGQADLPARLGFEPGDALDFVATAHEPTTEGIDARVAALHAGAWTSPCAVVGLGGGITMDTAKAVSNLLGNGGQAADYQGWDLLQQPGVFKIGVPTISGTGAEATRTCVMTNKASGLKLGMNSDFTVFDHVIMDPELSATVPRDQYFFTGMDAYIHCVEALEGSYRNAIGDAYSRETLQLCRQVFGEGDMMGAVQRERLMVASFLGGCAIATSYVGVVHPLSAGLSVVLGLHHCVANCIVMRAMQDFYPKAYAEFWSWVDQQKVAVPGGVCAGLDAKGFDALYAASIVHAKPLTNALGENFKDVLTRERVESLFRMM